MILIIVLCLFTRGHAEPQSTGQNLGCGEQGDCLTAAVNCEEKCGCDKIFYYNETSNECVVDFNYLRQAMVEKHNVEDLNDNLTEDNLARKIRMEAEKAFNGIMISVMLFVACSTVCAFTACIYCCHIDYTDKKLRKDVKALARKLKRDGKFPKSKKVPVEPVAQSCNIIVEEAGVFVV